MHDLSPDLADPDRRLHVAVVSDTHRRPTGGPADPPPLPAPLLVELAEADLILHAGDVVTLRLLEQLSAIAPTAAVLGNNDHGLAGVLPETRELTLAGVRVAMIHDSGPRAGRPRRLRARFPRADLVVFGHSHQPVDEAGIEGQWLFNPGSPTQRRRQPHPTMGVLDLADGRVAGHRIVALTT
jgi:putative phosphoesterase